MNREELDRLWHDDRHWRLFKEIYVCPEDPRLFVKKRSACGWTFNFARKTAIPTLILMVVTMGAPVVAMVSRGDKVSVGLGIGTTLVVLAGWVAVSIRSERGGN